jgi:Flp pilus assembly protein TadD
MLGRFGEAEAMLKKSLALKPTAAGYSNLGTLYFFQGRYEEAVIPMEKAVELEPHDYMCWGNLADAYRWSPKLGSKASKAYRRAVDLARRELGVNPSDAAVRGSLTTFLAKLGENEAAVAEVEEAVRLAPADTNIMMNAVLVYELAGERDRALSALGDALRGGYSMEEFQRDPEFTDLRADPRYVTLAIAK